MSPAKQLRTIIGNQSSGNALFFLFTAYSLCHLSNSPDGLVYLEVVVGGQSRNGTVESGILQHFARDTASHGALLPHLHTAQLLLSSAIGNQPDM